jgi:hypothetical protein
MENIHPYVEMIRQPIRISIGSDTVQLVEKVQPQDPHFASQNRL